MHACWAVSRKSRRSPFLCPPNSATLMQTSCLFVCVGGKGSSFLGLPALLQSQWDVEAMGFVSAHINQHSEISRPLLWLRNVPFNLDLGWENTKQPSSRGLSRHPQHISHEAFPDKLYTPRMLYGVWAHPKCLLKKCWYFWGFAPQQPNKSTWCGRGRVTGCLNL